LWVRKSRKETTSPSETGCQICRLSSSIIKYWCGWTGDGCEIQREGKYGSRGGVGIRARGGRWFSCTKDGGGGDGSRGRGRGGRTGDGEKEKGDGVRETGDLGEGEWTWYDGEVERDRGPKVNSSRSFFLLRLGNVKRVRVLEQCGGGRGKEVDVLIVRSRGS
jgi:hypothetical protein